MTSTAIVTTSKERLDPSAPGARSLALAEKFRALREYLAEAFVSRQLEARMLVLAALAGEHVVLIGPPGTAKSMLVREFSSAFQARRFELLFTRFTTPDEVFGPFRLTALQNDRFSRNTVGRLPESEVAFLDEVFKAGGGVLNAMLAALNERVFHDDGTARPIPLRIAVGASNELPDGEELSALWDRFLVRLQVEGIASHAQKVQLLTRVLTPDVASHVGKPQLSLAELDEARSLVRSVNFSSESIESFARMVSDLQAEVPLSDRRMVKLANLVRAAAWIEGETEVDVDHFEAVRHCVWSQPSDMPKVNPIVDKHARGWLGKAQELYDATLPVIKADLGNGNGDRAVKAMADTERLAKQLRQMGEQTRPKSRAREAIRTMLTELRTLHEQAVKAASAAYEIEDVNTGDAVVDMKIGSKLP